MFDPSEFGKVIPVKTTLPEPATANVKSALEGAVNVEPIADKSPKLDADPPAIVIVLVAPVPVATTPEPTKFKIVPVVDRALPSSCTVTPPPPLPPTEVPPAVVPLPIFNVPSDTSTQR